MVDNVYLGNPNLKKDAWQDFQWIRDFLKG